jgi:hypothetical protein
MGVVPPHGGWGVVKELIGNSRGGRDGLLGARFLGREHFRIEDDEE